MSYDNKQIAGQKDPLNTIQVIEAAHPVPDQRSFDACREVVRIADNAGMHDLVFCLMSGGVSSLCIHPIADISIADKIENHTGPDCHCCLQQRVDHQLQRHR